MGKRQHKTFDQDTWNKVKTEYLAGASSRVLERKYGIPHTTILARLHSQKWDEDKNAVQDVFDQQVIATMSKNYTAVAENFVKAVQIASMKAVDGLIACDKDNWQALKGYTGILRDLKEIGVFRTDLDRAEQEARIRKLQKDAETVEQDTTVTVILADEVEKYAD